ncbi:MAG: hypothetical protein HKN00_06095 [Flavobacteriaceae bacterium]|nr:hypothetical protein [Bacteroidia bacterium]NNF74736.1 hypothetical protein [Flavobacteriaceae bacterium]NNK71707.1 hypothetical protein [Flavobacteriaceae bacterium]
MFKRIDAVKKLRQKQSRLFKGADILGQVRSILDQDQLKEDRIQNALQGGGDEISNTFDLDQLDSDRIYHIDSIKEICIDYRLRFLNSKLFKNAIPREAIQEIKALEKAHDIEIKGFKIMAPSKLFRLENADDPVLFAPIGNGYYYLIHKWGNDMHPLRKWIMKPFKNIVNMVFTLFIISILSTNLVIEGRYGATLSGSEMMIIFLFVFKSFVAIVLYYGFALGKNFSNVVWDSKYFNA